LTFVSTFLPLKTTVILFDISFFAYCFFQGYLGSQEDEDLGAFAFVRGCERSK
jgi:hypothetical protein